MTTIENEYIKGEATHVGIYLLEMTTTGNLIAIIEYLVKVNYMLEMTTIENKEISKPTRP